MLGHYRRCFSSPLKRVSVSVSLFCASMVPASYRHSFLPVLAQAWDAKLCGRSCSEEIKPIKLYPPPPPPVIERPPLVHLEQTSSRPSSLFSVESAMSGHSSRNAWGGMEKQFGKPPPRFRRGGANVLAASGIVMPKKREQVVRERERRMSTYAPQGMDWEAGAGAFDPTAPPQRGASPPPQTGTPAIQLPGSPPTRSTRPSLPYVAQRANSAPPALAMSPPMILITSDLMGSLTTETAHSAESFESDDCSQLESSLDHSDGTTSIVDSPVAFTPPSLPFPPSSTSVSDSAEADIMISQSLNDTARPKPTALDLDLGAPVGQAPSARMHVPSETDTAGPLVESTSATNSLREEKSRKRRSMSLTSIPASKPAEEAPSIPSAQPGPNAKVIRKHKSLKKFFFSSDNLAKQEQEPVPPFDLRRVKEKEAQRREEEKPKHEKANNVEESEGVEQDGGHEKRDRPKDDKKREMNKRSSLGGMLSRPKSKPSLRIDVKVSKHAEAPTSSSAAEADASTTTPAPLTGSSTATSSTSEPYPETPSSRSSFKSKGKVGTPASESAGGTRGLTKRFSLSNMSSAFKRSKKDGVFVPQVPELPAAYKRDKAGRSMSADSASTPTATVIRDIKQSAVPLSPKLQESAIIDSPQTRPRSLLSPKNSPGSSVKALPDPEPSSPGATSLHSVRSVSTAHTLNAPGSPTHDDTSILSDTSSNFELETELNHAQLVLVSPRTRRNPAESLQDILGVAPVTRQSTIVKMDPVLSRRSVEAIVLGPLLMSPGEMAPLSEEDECGITHDPSDPDNVRRGSDSLATSDHAGHIRSDSPHQYDSESSLESLSRSSSTSDPLEHAPVTPSSADCGPTLELPPPLPPMGNALDVGLSTVPFDDGVIVDTPSMHEMYESPTSTIATSRRSPEGLFRFLSSGHSPKTSPKTSVKELEGASKSNPKSTHVSAASRSSVKAVKSGAKAVTVSFPLPPPPVPETKEYSSFNNEVQLRSLHFDSGLGLDFEFGFGAEEISDAARRDIEVGVEVLA